jgi:hypothetical protein
VRRSWNEYAPEGGNDQQSSQNCLPNVFRGLAGLAAARGLTLKQGAGKEGIVGFVRPLTQACFRKKAGSEGTRK